MKKKHIPIEQYAFSTKNFDGPSDDFLEKTAPLIGYVVHNFNSLEEELNQSICELISNRADSLGLQVIFNRSYSQKVDLFKRLLTDMQLCCEKQIPIADKLVSNLDKAGQLRNQVVHADWLSAHDDGYTLYKLIINNKGMTHEYIQFSPDALSKIIEFIDETAKMFEIYEDQMQDFYAI